MARLLNSYGHGLNIFPPMHGSISTKNTGANKIYTLDIEKSVNF